MISKRTEVPESLRCTKVYDGEDVQLALAEDQKDKCYLCERIRITDYHIDHFWNQKNYPELVNAWPNLLFACSYCNGRKSAANHLINPLTCNVEDEICQQIDFREKRACFMTVADDETHNETVKLLNRLYNGEEGKLRKSREERFFYEAVGVLNQFQQVVDFYLDDPTPENKEAVKAQFQIDQELLGFNIGLYVRIRN